MGSREIRCSGLKITAPKARANDRSFASVKYYSPPTIIYYIVYGIHNTLPADTGVVYPLPTPLAGQSSSATPLHLAIPLPLTMIETPAFRTIYDRHRSGFDRTAVFFSFFYYQNVCPNGQCMDLVDRICLFFLETRQTVKFSVEKSSSNPDHYDI